MRFAGGSLFLFLFVAQKLATIESIVATSTHFVLRKYKDKGVIYGPCEIDMRGTM